jgi:hypothetical protein
MCLCDATAAVWPLSSRLTELSFKEDRPQNLSFHTTATNSIEVKTKSGAPRYETRVPKPPQTKRVSRKEEPVINERAQKITKAEGPVGA